MFCVVALSSGGVLELPWMLLDPRRPLSSTPELREEPVIPYMPELPTLPEAIINYNQTMFRVRGIHTSPSGLESTCLVFVYGLGQYTTYKCCLTKLLLCVMLGCMHLFAENFLRKIIVQVPHLSLYTRRGVIPPLSQTAHR